MAWISQLPTPSTTRFAPILTYTYGSCEQILTTAGNAFYNNLWQQAAAQGITVLVATGDNGAAACDTPGSLGALGQCREWGSQHAIQPGRWWNAIQRYRGRERLTGARPMLPIFLLPSDTYRKRRGMKAATFLAAIGSDELRLFPRMAISVRWRGAAVPAGFTSKPSWQTGTGVPADGFRDIPDVSLAAASGHDDLVYCNSLGGTPCEINSQNEVVGLSLVGGTSASTPAMAGILALVEQKMARFRER